MSVRVYKFGLLAPTSNEDLVRRQMRAAHIYRNTLTEIERGRRDAERSAISASDAVTVAEAELDAASAAVKEAEDEVKQKRAKVRARRVETDEQRAAVKAAKARLKTARAALGQIRRAAKVELADTRKELEGHSKELIKSAREHCGTYWGTYLLVENASDQSRKTTPLYEYGLPKDPRFVRWHGEGRVGVQIQAQAGKPPFLSEHVFKANTLLQIAGVDERAWLPETPRGDRRRLSRTTLRMRVESDEKKRPIWAEWPMVMHRPLPAGVIKCAAVSLRKIGPREVWSVEITVDEAPARPTCGEGTVAVHLGWHKVENGVRVATWMTPTGEAGELVLGDVGRRDGVWVRQNGTKVAGPTASETVLSGLERADWLRSTRDKRFDEAREALCAWLTENDAPGWMREATATLHAWKSEARLAALALRWRRNRWAGDDAAYDALETWRYHDYHLWQWESNQRTSALRQRREVYRLFAAELSRRFGTVIIDDTRLDKVAQRPNVEDEEGHKKAQQAARQKVAVSELRTCIKNAFTGRGGTVAVVEAQNISATCPSCGTVKASHVDVESHSTACPSCGYVWGMDKTALVNMLARSGFDTTGILARRAQADGSLKRAA